MKYLPCPVETFLEPTLEVARNLLGALLVRYKEDALIVGRIVECEAYLSDDEACHAARGKTRRNAPMFGPPGTAYVYLVYGMYHCFNVVCAEPGVPEAVLIRAVEPVEGFPAESVRRLRRLCSGPGRLCRTFELTSDLSGTPLQAPPVVLACGGLEQGETIVAAPRIGIRKGKTKPWRFYVKENPYVSQP